MKNIAKWAVKQLPFDLLYNVFYQSGRALGVTGYETFGDYGTFSGSFADQSILREYLRRRSFSSIISTMFSDFFAKRGGGTFFDVGANIGMVTVPVARNAAVNCIAFEPDSRNFAHLRTNVFVNCTNENIDLVNAAVADKRGSLRFTRSEYNSGDHRLSAEGEVVVPTVVLDDYAPQKLPLGIKIDCQGAEPLIIAGGRTILKGADLLVCEFWPFGMKRMGLQVEPVVDFCARSFPQGQLLRHGEIPATPQPIEKVVEAMRAMIADGGEFVQADLVLSR